jgi:hypothetical protein
MAKSLSDVQALLEAAEKQAEKIQALYGRALEGEQIQDQLAVLVKNMLENLRSALDYLGHHIRKRCCPSANPKKLFYFPLLRTKADFLRKMKDWYPGLKENCPEIWRYLEGIQPYPQRGKRLRSLRDLKRLSNLTKHSRLVRQLRREAAVNDSKAPALGPAVFQVKSAGDHWVDFVFEGTKISAVWLPQGALTWVRTIVEEVSDRLV